MSEYIITDKQLGLIQDFATVCVEGEKLPRIVRCRDCKFNETVPEDSGDWCGYWTDRIYADTRGSGFCAWGERRGE